MHHQMMYLPRASNKDSKFHQRQKYSTAFHQYHPQPISIHLYLQATKRLWLTFTCKFPPLFRRCCISTKCRNQLWRSTFWLTASRTASNIFIYSIKEPVKQMSIKIQNLFYGWHFLKISKNVFSIDAANQPKAV